MRGGLSWPVRYVPAPNHRERHAAIFVCRSRLEEVTARDKMYCPRSSCLRFINLDLRPPGQGVRMNCPGKGCVLCNNNNISTTTTTISTTAINNSNSSNNINNYVFPVHTLGVHLNHPERVNISWPGFPIFWAFLTRTLCCLNRYVVESFACSRDSCYETLYVFSVRWARGCIHNAYIKLGRGFQFRKDSAPYHVRHVLQYTVFQ